MTPLEFLYFLGLSVKKIYSLRHQEILPRKVISIGNLTLGGTGKTPATIALAKEAGNRDFKPCVLTRGYKGKAGAPCFVSRGEGALLDACRAGDEAVLMSEKLSGVPIIKGRNRYEAGEFALSALPAALSPDVFILDDGFQHWRLWRDKDILLIDGVRPFGNRRILPLGPLREPIAAMNRADIIVITRTDSSVRNRKSGVGGLIKEIRQYNVKAPVFLARHIPSNFVTAKGDRFPLEWAKGKSFFGFCGIGNHRSFRETLVSAGVELTGFKRFRDHHKYSAGDIKAITADAKTSSASWIVTTEKDIMRLKGFELPEKLVALTIEFYADEGFYDEVFEGMQHSK
jgi:tetraacyldisaccharide 4'-kinase